MTFLRDGYLRVNVPIIPLGKKRTRRLIMTPRMRRFNKGYLPQII
jgi:hypothetical protein